MDTSIDQTLGELATHYASASRVFHRAGLDYCCGGKRTLAEACEPLDLDPRTVLEQLEGTSNSEPSAQWSERPLDELIDHIIRRYHEPLREELPELVALAEKVEARHADKPNCPHGIAAHLRQVHQAVLEHLAKEEQVLFPMILAGHGSMAGPPIQVMEMEHEDHGANLARTRELTHELQAPPEACPTWQALYLRLDELEAELMEHIHLENNVLFPRALCA